MIKNFVRYLVQLEASYRRPRAIMRTEGSYVRMIVLPYALKNLRCVGKGDRAHIGSLCALCPISRTGLLRTNFRKEKILVLHF